MGLVIHTKPINPNANEAGIKRFVCITKRFQPEGLRFISITEPFSVRWTGVFCGNTSTKLMCKHIKQIDVTYRPDCSKQFPTVKIPVENLVTLVRIWRDIYLYIQAPYMNAGTQVICKH